MTSGAAAPGRRPPAAALREAPVGDGPVPRLELAEWRRDFGLVAGITGRGGEPGGFDLGLWTGQPVGETMGRWRAFRAATGFAAVVMAHQVHGAEVCWHDQGRGWTVLDGVDGHATDRSGLLLAVTVADCIPVYLAEPARGVIALLHAGWRGTAAGILRRGVALLAERAGCRPDRLVMHAGVGICGACYEVGAEVVAGCGLGAEGPGPWHVDLRERLAVQAGELGIGRVTVSPWCTVHDAGLFHSHRASGGRAGRMVAYLGVPAADAKVVAAGR